MGEISRILTRHLKLKRHRWRSWQMKWKIISVSTNPVSFLCAEISKTKLSLYGILVDIIITYCGLPVTQLPRPGAPLYVSVKQSEKSAFSFQAAGDANFRKEVGVSILLLLWIRIQNLLKILGSPWIYSTQHGPKTAPWSPGKSFTSDQRCFGAALAKVSRTM